MSDYYEGAYRTSHGGVPCRVFIKGGAPKAQRDLITLASTAGVEMAHEDLPETFTFTPAKLSEHVVQGKAARYRASIPAIPAPKNTDYYDDHVRVTVHGVPCRLARRSKNHSLKHWADGGSLRETGCTGSFSDYEYKRVLIAEGRYEAAGVPRPKGA